MRSGTFCLKSGASKQNQKQLTCIDRFHRSYLCEKLHLLEAGNNLKGHKHLRVHLTDQKLVHGKVAGAEIELNLLPDGQHKSFASQFRLVRRAFTSADIRHDVLNGGAKGLEMEDA